jgi:hypothetical protein
VEQRSARRFSLRLPLAITRAGTAPVSHSCCTRNISSAGVLFVSSQEIASDRVEYIVTLASGEDRAVTIRCLGTVVRNEKADSEDAFYIAATLDRYEFVRQESAVSVRCVSG